MKNWASFINCTPHFYFVRAPLLHRRVPQQFPSNGCGKRTERSVLHNALNPEGSCVGSGVGTLCGREGDSVLMCARDVV